METKIKPPCFWTARHIFFLAFVVLFLVGNFYSAARPVDDAYITYRFAANLATGHGISFNPGELVEGYTSFAQLLLMAPFAAINKTLVQSWSILLGLLAWAGVVALVWRRIIRERGLRPATLPEWFVMVYLATCSPGVIWAWSGMETSLFAFAWVLAWTLHLDEYEQNKWPIGSALANFAAGLLHPEGVLVGIVLGLAWLWPYNQARLKKSIAYWAIAYGLFGAYWLWRWHYFGFFFPNTFYAKVGSGGALLQAGLSYVGLSTVSALLPIIVGYLAIRERKNYRCWPRWMWIGFGLTFLLVAYVIYVGGDYFSFQRFLLPAYPFFVLALWRLWSDRRAQKPGPADDAAAEPDFRRKHPLLAALLLVALLNVWSNLVPRMHMLQHKLLQDAVLEFTAVGGEFVKAVPANAVVATIPIGAFGYYSNLKILDLMGLTDKYLAHLDRRTGRRNVGHEKYDYQYVLKQRPEVIIQLPALFSADERGQEIWLRQTTLNPQQYTIYNQPELRSGYYLCFLDVPNGKKASLLRRRLPPGNLGVYAYLRKDLINKPEYENWRALSPGRAQKPFLEFRNSIEENKRSLRRGRLGMWSFQTATDDDSPTPPDESVPVPLPPAQETPPQP